MTWPVHLAEKINPELVLYLGQGAAGNGIISRKIIYHVTEQLKTYVPQDILVGIMWSGYDRRDMFTTTEPHDIKRIDDKGEQYSNPVRIAGDRNFYLTHNYWKDPITTKYLNQTEDALLITLEHMLRTQWFLEKHNVKYFMTEFHPLCLDKELIESDKDLKFLYSQINLDHWLPISNCYDWVKDESGFTFDREDPHPSTNQHKAFVDRVIVPFLLGKNLIPVTIT